MYSHTGKKVGVVLALLGLVGLPWPLARAETPKDGVPAAAAQTAAKPAEKKTVKAAPKKTPKVKKMPKKDGAAKPEVPVTSRDGAPVLQRGELLSEAVGDVDGDGREETIELLGSPAVDQSSYRGEMYLIVREVGDKNPTRVKYYYRPKDLGGYNAYLTLADVTGSGAPDVIIASPSGGTAGVTEYRIIDFSSGKPEEIFTASDNRGVSMVGTYLPDYQASLRFPSLNQEVTVDLASQKDAYRNLNVYEEDGELKESGLRPMIQNISQLSTLDVDGNGVDEVVTLQPVLGAPNADQLGMVRTVWEYRAGQWQPREVHFAAELYSRPTYQNTDLVKGDGGYEIAKLKVAAGVGGIEYPHFQKLDGRTAWKINHVLEDFVRQNLKKVDVGTQLNLTYDVKYSGTHYASIMMLGLFNDRDKSETIAKCFNFDLNTGKEVTLKDMLHPWGKFWKMAAKEVKDAPVNEKTVTDYYLDGSVLGLFYGDRKEYDLDWEKVLPFLGKNLPGEEFLTDQSKEDLTNKDAKTEDKTEKTTESKD